MDLTLVVAGGYWSISKKVHQQVDPENDTQDRGVDYALRVKGLPESFFPSEPKKKVQYFCTTCGDQPVPEWEVENKVGCFMNHKCRQEMTIEKTYPVYIYGPVSDQIKKKKPMMKDGMVLWVNNPQGLEKLEKIFDFISRSLPAGEVMPKPIAVGTKNAWNLESVDDIPLVDITKYVEQEKNVNTGKPEVEKQECQHCGAMINTGEQALRMHIMAKHRKIFDEKYSKIGKAAKATKTE